MNVFKNNTFLDYVLIAFFANLLDIVRCAFLMTLSVKNYKAAIVFTGLYYSFLVNLPVFFALYGYSLVSDSQNRLSKVSVFVKVLLVLPVFITLLFIWVSIFLPFPKISLAFYDAENNRIVNSYFSFCVLYVCSYFYTLIGLVNVITYRKNMDRGELIRFVTILISINCTVMAQKNIPNVRFLTFAISMTCLTLSFYIQKPDAIYNSDLGVFNFKGFQMVINHFFAIKKKFSLISIVMDDVSFYESALGRKEKENLEACIINTLNQKFKKNCSVFRFSYGNYALVIKDNKMIDAEMAMDYIKNQIDMRWGFSSMELDLTFRTCVIIAFQDVSSYDEIIDLIDYFSLNKKFKTKSLSATSMDLSKLHSKSYLEKAIHDGLKNNRFEVYFQPLYSVKDNKLDGAEALIRLRDEEGNFVSPEDFIPIAEKNGTIFDIGKFVFTNVCDTLSKINLNDYNIHKIDINLSVVQCIQEDMYKQLIMIRNNYNIPSNYLNLEITETSTINSPEVLLKNMKHLEDDGIELSLDDYGSGHSNISYILSLPFKMIKIDKGIVWKAFETQRADIALKATIDMMKSLGMKIVAEGVETEEQSKRLIELGCDYLQGYYYSRPIDCQSFLNLMKK